jgi:hypothetical protein
MARNVKPKTTSPSKVLVIFLVFFILTNIAFALWVYTYAKERDKWDGAAKAKEAELKSVRQDLDWNKYKVDELLAALGEPEFSKKAETHKNWLDNRDSFLKGEKFKNEEGDVEFKGLMKIIAEKLDGFDTDYKNKFLELPDTLKAKLAAAEKKLGEEEKKNLEQKQELITLQKKYNADRDAIIKEIKDGNDKIIKARSDASEALTQALKRNDDLAKSIEEKDQDYTAKLTAKDARIKALEEKAKIQEAVSKSPNRSATDLHSLMLDVSRGKPLWDMPRGKIIRVEDGAKRVVIDKGSRDRVKPGLTFSVFAAGSGGRGEGKLKATIEVIRVIDAGSSLCKVNSLYDADGSEVPVSSTTPSRVLRDGGSALQPGDLLFNLFWGSHVAVVGIIDFPGYEAKSPAGQMDDMNAFLRQLERMGVIVDAYTDLRDGKLVGELSLNTNFVILGSPVLKSGDAAGEGRAKGINEAIAKVRADAAERGMFIISPANFAVLSGHRRNGDDGTLQTLTFVPGRPSGSAPRQGTISPEIQKKN